MKTFILLIVLLAFSFSIATPKLIVVEKDSLSVKILKSDTVQEIDTVKALIPNESDSVALTKRRQSYQTSTETSNYISFLATPVKRSDCKHTPVQKSLRGSSELNG